MQGNPTQARVGGLSVFMLASAFLLLCPQTPQRPVQAPPQVMPHIQGVLKVLDRDLLAIVKADTGERRVRLEWVWNEGEETLRHHDSVRLSFWPTAVAPLENAQLLAAGIRPQDGKAVLQVVHLRFPDEPWRRRPGVRPEDGKTFLDPVPGRIKTIKPFPGRPTTAIFVRADGSVALVDYFNGQIDELFPAGQYPKLAVDHISAGFSGEHAEWGYVLLVMPYDTSVFLDGGVILKDIDKDGTIDEVLELSEAEWPGDEVYTRHF